ncbi:MAG: hypothetical protein AAF938_13680 [Myxococcota bacterium]
MLRIWRCSVAALLLLSGIASACADSDFSVIDADVRYDSSTSPAYDARTDDVRVDDALSDDMGAMDAMPGDAAVDAPAPAPDLGALRAFPGAEGFGRDATGGRGGQVLHVTNLNDSGPGSLRAALTTEGPRTVVFDVGGMIELESQLQIGSTNVETNRLREAVTIAGQTAPPPGITLHGGGLDIFTSNVIVRYLTVRLDIDEVETDDSVRIRNWGVDGYQQRDIILDHLSLSHGSDENLGVSSLSAEVTLERITVQNSLLGENTSQQKNFLRGAFVYKLSFLNNHMTHCVSRNPLIGYGANGETSEFINNVVYGGTMAISRGNVVDAIANIYRQIPARPQRFHVISLGSQGYDNPAGIGRIFVSENITVGPLQDGANFYNSELERENQSSRVLTDSTVLNWETDREQLETDVLSRVGNHLYRDSLDRLYIQNYVDGLGGFDYHDVPVREASARPDDYDTDRDGMADGWERRRWGDLLERGSDDDNGDGYTNLEAFLHEAASGDAS